MSENINRCPTGKRSTAKNIFVSIEMKQDKRSGINENMRGGRRSKDYVCFRNKEVSRLTCCIYNHAQTKPGSFRTVRLKFHQFRGENHEQDPIVREARIERRKAIHIRETL